MNPAAPFFQYQRGTLSSGGVSLPEIASSVGTPVYVYNSEAFLSPLQRLKKGLKGIDSLICFALKANSNLSVLKLLSETGIGMDVVSGGELYRAKLAGVPAERIIFSGVGKTEGEIASALQMDGKGIFAFNVESLSELEAVNRVAAMMHRKARVGLRFNPDVNAKTHPYISTGLKKNKFGLQKADILQIVHRIQDYPAIEIKGISIHIGSQLLSLSPLNDAFRKLRELLDEISPRLPTPLEFVDLGGGVGIQYKNEKPPEIEKYCALIQKHFGSGRNKSRMGQSLKILIEPGRILAGNSGILLTQVLYRKVGRDKDFLIIDAAMNDLMRPALYGSYHHVVSIRKVRADAPVRKTDLVGPVCETADCFGSDRKLPTLLGPGDLLAILSAGAYGFSMAGNYNSRPRPAEVLIANGDFRVIRKRETYEDLIRGELV